MAFLSRPSTRAATDLYKYAQKLRIAFATLLERLPDELRGLPEVALLAAEANEKVSNIVQLIYRAKKYEGAKGLRVFPADDGRARCHSHSEPSRNIRAAGQAGRRSHVGLQQHAATLNIPGVRMRSRSCTSCVSKPCCQASRPAISPRPLGVNRPENLVLLTPCLYRPMSAAMEENHRRMTRKSSHAVGSRLRDECHPARGSGVEADGLALAASLQEWCRRAPAAQGQGQGRAPARSRTLPKYGSRS